MIFFASVAHFYRQPQDDLRPGHQNSDGDQMGQEVRKHAMEYLADRTSRVTRYDKAVQPDGRRNHADFSGDNFDDAKPERIIAKRFDKRQNDGDREHEDRDLVHKGTKHDISKQDDRQDDPRRYVEASYKRHQVLRHLGQRKEIAEDRSPQQDHCDHAGAMRGTKQSAPQTLQIELSLPKRKAESAGGAERRGFGRSGYARIYYAGDHGEQEQHRPDDPQHPEFLVHRHRRTRRCPRGILPGQKPDSRHDGDGDEYSGNDAADQQRANVHLRKQAVDDQSDRWRDQHRQRAGDRNDASGHPWLVSLLKHRGKTGGRKRCG